MTQIKYLNTIKGKIIKAISVDQKYDWSEIRDLLGFTNDQLRPYIKELKAEGVLEENFSEFRVEYNLWLTYKAHFGDEWAKKKLRQIEEGTEWKQVILRRIAEEKKRESSLKARVKEWIKFKKIGLPENSSHIFLRWDQLDSLLRDLIPLTKKDIIVVNPFVEKSGLCDLLMLGVSGGARAANLSVRGTLQFPTGIRAHTRHYHCFKCDIDCACIVTLRSSLPQALLWAVWSTAARKIMMADRIPSAPRITPTIP